MQLVSTFDLLDGIYDLFFDSQIILELFASGEGD